MNNENNPTITTGQIYVLEHREKTTIDTVVMGVFSSLEKVVAAIRRIKESNGWFAVYVQVVDDCDFNDDSLWFFDLDGNQLQEQPIPNEESLFINNPPTSNLVGRPEDYKIVTEREAWENAAGYNLDYSFFQMNGINPDKLTIIPREPTHKQETKHE